MGGTIMVKNTEFKYDDKDYRGAEFTIILPIQ